MGIPSGLTKSTEHPSIASDRRPDVELATTEQIRPDSSRTHGFTTMVFDGLGLLHCSKGA